MGKKKIIQQLYDTSEWIVEMLNEEEQAQEHIKDMLEGIDNAISRLQKNVIEVEAMYIYTDDELSVQGYDIEGMRIEFEKKLENLTKND
jgi:hypothetical protein